MNQFRSVGFELAYALVELLFILFRDKHVQSA
jgi:hypothetical protein